MGEELIVKVEITIDRERCIGSGQCVHLAPQTFDQDDRALAFLKAPPGEPDERTLRAITGCPMAAIALKVGDTTVSADELRNWVTGLRSDDPLVELIGWSSESHHELREAMAAVATTGGDPSTMVELAQAHLAEEDGAYSTITELVDAALVEAFEADRRQIVQALDALGQPEPEGDPKRHDRSAIELAAALEEHIRLEEAVLFPLALAALADREASRC